jgi:sortase (surface protein transpeptidase)
VTHVRLQAVWRHRTAFLFTGVGMLAGLIIATLLHDPAPRAGLPIEPATAGVATNPVTDVDGAGAAPSAGPSARPAAAARNAHVQPGELSIPEIGVRSSFVNLSLNKDGTLQAPARYDVVGWYAAGPAPGDGGGPPAVLAGHVDSKSGPGVFFRLHELKIGGEFVVGGTDGAERRFRVYKTATYAKNAFPAKQVYAPSKRAEVRLITCTGTFDSRSGHYEGNLVVYAAQATA